MKLCNSNCCSSIWKWASNYVRFSKGAPFISGLHMSGSFLDNAFAAFLVAFIQFIWGEPSSFRKAAAFANAFQGATIFTSIILYSIAIGRKGYFKVIMCTVPALMIGLLVLWISHISNPGIVYIGLTLVMIGIAGQFPSRNEFLRFQFYWTLDIDETETFHDQFSEKQKMDEIEDALDNRVAIWKKIAMFLGTFTASTFTSSLSWKDTFMVSLIIVGVAYLVFCSGKHCYKHADPVGQTVASRLKDARPLLKLLPLWMTFTVYSLVEATGYTLFIEQSYNLNDRIDLRIPIHSFNRIPATSFYVLQKFTSFVTSLLSDFLIKKFWSRKEIVQHRARFVRIGIGILFAFGCCIVAWRVEVHRLNLTSESGNKGNISMKILWLTPQFWLLGIVQGLVGKGLNRLFYDRVPVSMRYLEYPFTEAVFGIGRFLSVFLLLLARPWIGDTIDESHFDKYYLMLAILNIFTLFVYIFLTCKCNLNVVVPAMESHVPREEVAGQTELVMASSHVPREEAASWTESVMASSHLPREEVAGRTESVMASSSSAPLEPKSKSPSKSWSNPEFHPAAKDVIERSHSWPTRKMKVNVNLALSV